MTKGIFIDVRRRAIREIELEINYDIQALLGERCQDIRYRELGDGHAVYTDAFYHEDELPMDFYIKGIGGFTGNALILKYRHVIDICSFGGADLRVHETDVTFSVEEITGRTYFLEQAWEMPSDKIRLEKMSKGIRARWKAIERNWSVLEETEDGLEEKNRAKDAGLVEIEDQREKKIEIENSGPEKKTEIKKSER